jgi:hypothetical protein
MNAEANMNLLPVLIATVLLSATGSSLRAAPFTHAKAKENTETTEIDRVDRVKPALRGVDLVLSKIDRGVVDELEKSWASVQYGHSNIESVILILRTETGYQARRQKLTYEFKKCTFPWHPATVAVIHTHPNDAPPRPQPDDIKVANTFHVPMFTITLNGMFVYDPETRKISKVMDGLDWLDASKWNERPILLNR